MPPKNDSTKTSSTEPMEEMCGDDVGPTDVALATGNQSKMHHELTFTLESDKKGDTHVSVSDVARLVYNRLMAPPKSLILYDDTQFKKLTLWLRPEVDVGRLILTQGLEIRPGLRTKPLVGANREKDVHIYWAPISLTNEAIAKSLEVFGDLKEHFASDGDTVFHVWNKIYKAKEDDDDVTKMMDGVTLTDRQCKMIVKHPIPSHILIGGVKVKISYEGQARTCGRCYKYWSACPGGGKADICRAKAEEAAREAESGGKKKQKAPSMKEHWKKVEKKLAKKMAEGQNPSLNEGVAGKPPPPTCVRVTSLPDDITLPEFINILKSNHCDIADVEDKISFDNNVKGAAVIRGLDPIDYELIQEHIEGVHLRGKRFKVVPVQESTPSKSAEVEMTEPPTGAEAGAASPALSLKVSQNTVENNSISNALERTPPHVGRVESLVNKFKLVEQTEGGSKVYSRIINGKTVTSKKKLRMSDSDDSPPKSSVKHRTRSKKKHRENEIVNNDG